MSEIVVREIGKAYGRPGSTVDALTDVSFTTEPGEFVCLVGPSGCGKTTLLKIIGDLIAPSRGSVTVADLSPQAARKAHYFSWVFQTPVLLPWRDLLQNIMLPQEIQREQTTRDPAALLKLVGLEGFEHHRPAQLSGGMQQRAALARSLLVEPKILLMDEPFAAVDEFTRATLNVELVKICQATGVSVLFVTHSIAEAVFLGDRVIVLSHRPGTVKAVVEVPLPRPRDNSIRNLEQFREIVQCVESHIS